MKRMAQVSFLLLTATLFAPLASAQDAKKPAKAANAITLVYFGKSQPVLIRINVQIDGKTRQEQLDSYLEKWFRYADVNNDGFLDSEEVRRAPLHQILSQLMVQGVSFPTPGFAMTLASFGKEDNEKLTLKQFQAYYGRFVGPTKAVGPVVNNNNFVMMLDNGVVLSSPNGAGKGKKAAGEALFKALDLDKDGKLSKDEILAAAKTLRKFDFNEVEWVTERDLVPTQGTPLDGIQFQIMGGRPATKREKISDAFYQILPGDNELPNLLLNRYGGNESKTLSQKQIGLGKETFAKLDWNNDGTLDLSELAHFHERPADLEFTIDLGREGGTTKLHKPAKGFASTVQETSGGAQLVLLDDAEMQLLSRRSRFGNREQLTQAYVELLRRADTKKQGYVERKDLEGQQFQFLRQYFTFFDWNSDDKLTEQEVRQYFELLMQASDYNVALIVSDQGRDLFQLLDTNRDGRLSQRELLSAWTRLAPLDKKKTGFIIHDDLPRLLQLTMQHGPSSAGTFEPNFVAAAPASPPGRPSLPKETPEWFRKMDTNGDGDVSVAEFLGGREEFDRIDTNHDGLISPEEAIRYDALMRGNVNS